ncbi:MAG TPA: amidohydrolase family protein [Gaiellaceae bacterium]|nr:amidohydrolase family protein [Gaiellaceae bacterium]
MTSRHTLEGVLVDPLDGAGPGRLVWEADRIVAVERLEGGPTEPLVFPGFVDLQVYEPAGLARHGVTAYLLATRRVQEVADPLCLGLHLEGPFLNPDAAGAIPRDELTPVDLVALEEWLASGLVRLVTLAPELRHALAAIHHVAGRGAVAAIGHSHANAITTLAAVNAGARFATHVWNAMAPVRARATGPIPTLLLDQRVVLGVIADGRHLHPRIEQLTVAVAGPQRIALTSDLVAAPGQRADGSLLGGSRCGAALVARMARFGLAEAAAMASLVPARVLGLADRGRLTPGFRADFAVLGSDFSPLRTVAAGVEVWALRYPADELGRPPT